MQFSVRMRGNVDRLFLHLQRFHYLLQKHFPIGQERRNHIFTGRTDRHTIGRLVIRAKGKALPHRCRFAITYLGAITFDIFARHHCLHPISKTTHKFAVVVRIARGKVEFPICPNRTDGASRHTEFAPQTRVIVQRHTRHADFGRDQNSAEQNKVAKLGVDHIAVDPHHPQPRGLRNRLV